GWRTQEIVSNPEPMFDLASQRVQVHWRHEEPIPLDQLAEELSQYRQVLCIVNLKRHANELAETLFQRKLKGTLHLSTNMCTKHREVVLDEVDRRLMKEMPVRLIATQCVEAGVDLDFP